MNPLRTTPATSMYPERYKRRALVCVAGLTPATITETLFALAMPPEAAGDEASEEPHETHDERAARAMLGALGADYCLPTARPYGVPAKAAGSGQAQTAAPFIPTEIHIITTSAGHAVIQKGLCQAPDGLEHLYPRGVLQHLVEDYPDAFAGVTSLADRVTFHLVCHADGSPVEDFATEADCSATGDTILNVVLPLVDDDDCAIHASFAGGRKSMGVMLDRVMTHLGRRQDRLSQVLVPEVFEVPSFLYPPPTPNTQFKGRNGRTVSTADAKIRLSTLPLLRIFSGLGLKLRQKRMTFLDLLRLGEMALHQQLIIVRPKQNCVQIGTLVCQLQSAQMALYALLVARRLDGATVPDDELQRAGGVRWGSLPVGFDPSDPSFLKARSWLSSASEMPKGDSNLKSLKSKLNSRLVDAFGEELAEAACIVGPKDTKGDGIFGLFNAQAIMFS